MSDRELPVIDLKRDDSTKDGILMRSDLLSAIDKEIDLQFTLHQRPGWTVWLLAVAVGAVAWQFLSDWNPATLDVVRVSIVVVFASMLFDLAVHFASMWGHSSHPAGGVARYQRSHHTLSGMRPYFLALLLRAIVLGCITIWLVPPQTSGRVWLLLHYGGVSVGLVFALTMTLARLPMPNNTKRSVGFTMFGLAIAVPSAVGIVAFAINPSALDPYSVKQGVLVATLLVLVTRLLRESRLLPIPVHLLHLRREVAFASMPLELASRQASQILTGLRAEDVLDEEVAALDILLSHIQQEQRSSHEAIGAIRKLAPSGLPQASEDRVMLLALLDSHERCLERAGIRRKDFRKGLSSLQKRLAFLSGIGFERATIKQRLTSLERTARETSDSFDLMLKDWQSWRGQTNLGAGDDRQGQQFFSNSTGIKQR